MKLCEDEKDYVSVLYHLQVVEQSLFPSQQTSFYHFIHLDISVAMVPKCFFTRQPVERLLGILSK